MQETQEMWVRSLGQEDPLEQGMAIHSSTLDWTVPWTEGPGGLQLFKTPVRNHSHPEICTSCTF